VLPNNTRRTRRHRDATIAGGVHGGGARSLCGGRSGDQGTNLDEYCRTAGCHRKAAIRALRRPPTQRGRGPGRRRHYDLAVVPAQERLWEISDRLCGKLLRAARPTLLSALERHGGLRLPPEHRRQLLTMSAATIDRLLRPSRARRGRQLHRTSPATSALKQQIPIRTWGD
jgi:hypothetical protein